MLIANPIYDVVFKYLLEDEKVAKLFLGAILEKEIIELEFKPQEYSTKREDSTLTVYRVDFKAKIKINENETKVVLIELQKAKFYTDLMRFRRYLGRQYANEDNTIKDKDGVITEVLPIITIYFIAYTLPELKGIPIIYVKREYIDKSTNQIINKKAEFIESLTHDSIIIQIEEIKNKKHKNQLEKILSIFDTERKHTISIDENDYPQKYKPIIRRLIKAIANEEMEVKMEIEDDYIEDIKREERKRIEAEKRAKWLEEEKRKAEEEKQRVERQLKQQKFETAKSLLKNGINDDIIQASTGLSKDEIEKIKRKL